jgi:Ca2+-transporting ATPase
MSRNLMVMVDGDLTAESPGGLTSDEARARLATHGPNRLVGRERAAWLKEAVGLLLDPMAIMLVVAAAIYFALGDRRDAVVMLAALVPVIGVDVFLEARSRSALKQLARQVAPRARVIRDGRELVVETAALVPGDLLVLVEGDVIHADGIVRSAVNLAVDESSLTGESDPQLKRPAPARQADPPPEARFYAGSLVLAGHGHGEILATGRATRFGEIAALVGKADTTTTPLQRRVASLVKKLAVVAGAVAIAVVLLGVARGLSWGQALLGGISIAMSAAPEEFPLVFTLFLSVGAWKLTKRGVLVRRLASVETLGSTTVICTDKTGTLTRGQFVLDQIVPLLGADERELLETAVLASELPPSDPMEKAIVATAHARGVEVAPLTARWQLVRDYDFDPVGKHMSHVWTMRDAPATACVVAKGALEGVLEHAAISDADRATLEAANARLAVQGIRVLAVARRADAQAQAATREDDERQLSIVGLLGFRDPLRPEVPAAVRECQAAGVRIKIVTGDHALTAHAIAESAGILHRDDAIISGETLAAASSAEERTRLVTGADILSRISPAQKHMIVGILRDEGEIVAMTGDGINDAPALKRADIGVSMGQRGTEVARAAADLVLLDDDFASIVAAVAAGRKIFLDIQRSFLYLIAFHIPIVGLALIPPVVGLPLLLLPIHLVWLELIVHPVSALLFQGDPPPDDLMRRPPRDPRAPMLAGRAVWRSAASGALLTIAVIATYAARLPHGHPHARGMALAVLIAGYQLIALHERAASGDRAGTFLPRSIRPWLVLGASAASLPVLMYTPTLAALMDVAPLSATAWLGAIGIALGAVGWRLRERPSR